MVEITLVRHGQAQTGASDEASYDSLSDLGRQQARWLGEHWAAAGHGFDHVIAGGMQRHDQTAAELTAPLRLDYSRDERLNEFDYFGLAHSLKDTHALDMPEDRESFITHIPQVLAAWQAGDIHSHLESYQAFQSRIHAAIAHAETLGGRVLLVTSGGVIGTAMRHAMQLELAPFAGVLLQIQNTSLHRYVKEGDQLYLSTFNATPHLEPAARAHARTFI